MKHLSTTRYVIAMVYLTAIAISSAADLASFQHSLRVSAEQETPLSKAFLQEIDADPVATEAFLKSAVSTTIKKLYPVEIHTPIAVLTGHQDDVRHIVACNGNILTAADDGTIRVWDEKTWECKKVLQGIFSSTQKSRTRGLVLGDNYIASVYESEHKCSFLGKRDSKTLEHNSEINIKAYHPSCLLYHDGDLIIGGWYSNMIHILDGATAACKRKLKGHTGVVDCLAVCNGDIVSGGSVGDCTVRQWDTSTGICKKVLKGHDNGVKCITTYGNTIFSGSFDTTIRAWNSDTGECIQVLNGHTGAVECITTSDEHIISGSSDHAVRIWDAQTYECKAILEGHTATIHCVAVHNGLILSGAWDHTVRVWQLPPLPLDGVAALKIALLYKKQEQGNAQRGVPAVGAEQKLAILHAMQN